MPPMKESAQPKRSHDPGLDGETPHGASEHSSRPQSSRQHSPPPRPTAPTPPPAGGPLQLRLASWSLLTFATFWGVLARLGLLWLGGFAGREVFASVWPQMVGCLVMGFVTERKKSLEAM